MVSGMEMDESDRRPTASDLRPYFANGRRSFARLAESTPKLGHAASKLFDPRARPGGTEVTYAHLLVD